MGFKIAVKFNEQLFYGHHEIIVNETMKCHMRGFLSFHDELETDIVFTQIFELAGRGIAVESEREQNTFEHLHAIISIRIAMREIDKLKHIDSFHDFFHRSGDIVRIDRIFINKIQRELKRWLNCVTIY